MTKEQIDAQLDYYSNVVKTYESLAQKEKHDSEKYSFYAEEANRYKHLRDALVLLER